MARAISLRISEVEKKETARFRHRCIGWFQTTGGFIFLIFQSFQELFTLFLTPKQYLYITSKQLLILGLQSVPLVTVTGLATGTVMALQFGYGLKRFGGTNYVPMLVGIAILRELGPVLTSLLLVGRIGSGMTSEIASMTATQQVDAIRASGTSPYSTLVVPRILACLIAFPILTLFSIYVSIASAMFICRAEFAMNYTFYLTKTVRAVSYSDLLTGIGKTILFGFITAVAACWKGLNATGGTRGVGNATTWVVVVSSILILIGDIFLSKLLIILGFFQ